MRALLFAAAIAAIAQASWAHEFAGISAETHEISQARHIGEEQTRVLVTVRNSTAVTLDVVVECSLFQGQAPRGSAGANVRAVPPESEVIGEVYGRDGADRAECRPIDARER